MERVHAIAPLACSVARAEELLPNYIAQHRGADGLVRIPLRVPLEDFGLPGALALSRNVEVTIEKRRDQYNLNDEFAVEWKPNDDAPFPTLHGRLTIWSESDPSESFIELDGSYEPPLGEFGEAFDATIGNLIAQRTATAFLRDLSDGVCALAHAR